MFLLLCCVQFLEQLFVVCCRCFVPQSAVRMGFLLAAKELGVSRLRPLPGVPVSTECGDNAKRSKRNVCVVLAQEAVRT